jgi:hypothetical protein
MATIDIFPADKKRLETMRKKLPEGSRWQYESFATLVKRILDGEGENAGT